MSTHFPKKILKQSSQAFSGRNKSDQHRQPLLYLQAVYHDGDYPQHFCQCHRQTSHKNTGKQAKQDDKKEAKGQMPLKQDPEVAQGASQNDCLFISVNMGRRPGSGCHPWNDPQHGDKAKHSGRHRYTAAKT